MLVCNYNYVRRKLGVKLFLRTAALFVTLLVDLVTVLFGECVSESCLPDIFPFTYKA